MTPFGSNADANLTKTLARLPPHSPTFPATGAARCSCDAARSLKTAPHAAFRPAVGVVETRGAESLSALDIVTVVRVPPVDDDVTGREARHEPIERSVDDCRFEA
jgi:hypothetical protein